MKNTDDRPVLTPPPAGRPGAASSPPATSPADKGDKGGRK